MYQELAQPTHCSLKFLFIEVPVPVCVVVFLDPLLWRQSLSDSERTYDSDNITILADCNSNLNELRFIDKT